MPTTAALGLWVALGSGPRATPPLPVAPVPEPPTFREPGTPGVLFINFDGAVLQQGCGNDARHDCSTLARRFEGYVGPYDGNDTQKMALLQAVRERVADFGIEVVIERPPPEVAYDMVLYGDLGPQSFAGIAPYIDCGDAYPADTSFAQGGDGSNSGATVVLQEAAHTWGLEHVDAEPDILHPFNAARFRQRFRDECFGIVANTDLDEAPGACNPIHARFCEPGHQNSHQELLYLFGPPRLDQQPPEFELLQPAPDAQYQAPIPSLAVVGHVSDDRHPQFYAVELTLQTPEGEAVTFERNASSLDDRLPVATLDHPPAGRYHLRVEIADAAGNRATDEARFTIAPPLPDETGTGTAAGAAGEAGCRLAPTPAGWVLWLLVGTRPRPRHVLGSPPRRSSA